MCVYVSIEWLKLGFGGERERERGEMSDLSGGEIGGYGGRGLKSQALDAVSIFLPSHCVRVCVCVFSLCLS